MGHELNSLDNILAAIRGLALESNSKGDERTVLVKDLVILADSIGELREQIDDKNKRIVQLHVQCNNAVAEGLSIASRLAPRLDVRI